MASRRSTDMYATGVQKLQLGDVLKRNFKNALIVEADLRNTLGKYSGLTPSLHYGSAGVLINLRGTIPFRFQNVVYNCPIRIALNPEYPLSPPYITVQPTEQIKIVQKHPCVLKNGDVVIRYLREWNPRATLVEALRYVQDEFDRAPPIYAVELRRSATLPAAASQGSGIATPLRHSATSSEGSMTPRGASDEGSLDAELESIRSRITANVRDMRAQLIKEYQYDVGKYDIHRLIMLDWVPTCVNIAKYIKEQYAEREKLNRARADCDKQLHTLEDIDDYFTQVIAALTKMQTPTGEADKSVSSDASEPNYNLEFDSQRDERLCRAVASEAAANEMMELLQATYKRKQISTKNYIYYVRLISNEKFRAMHARKAAAATR
ncbi:hypothetical protein, conserved [Babesia bigemina]|uniref:UEV domain-containing protein n=1 Tax=Babesia bigemina TaxID=5866 RepID=A0A061D9X4_BABBI|nr:hypothetical protein, conserved [Babesia bigemina]CDR94545.1 hypothetical protein, conserved [Babesia bigemina]|eukprot:XP_012766731.1 hypothetical protein, conserved [Babesia bigemina]